MDGLRVAASDRRARGGRHAFEVRARDAAGNEIVARWAFTVDTTALAPPTASQPAAPPVTAPLDTTPPRLALALASSKLGTVRASGLRVTVTPSERASISGQLVLDGRAAKRLGLSRGAAVVVGRASLAAGSGKRTLVIRLSARPKARFASVRSVTLSVKVRAQDASGNGATTVRRAVLAR